MNQIVRGGDDPTPPEGGTTRMPQTCGLRGQIPPSSRISKEIRAADTATMCQTQECQKPGSNPGPYPYWPYNPFMRFPEPQKHT